MNQRPREKQSDDGLITLALIPILLVVLWIGLGKSIIFGSCQILYWLYSVAPDQLVPGSRTDKMHLLNQAAIHRDNVSLTDFISLLNLTGSIAIPLVIAFSILFAYVILKSPFYKLTRRISIKDLPRIMLKYAPANAHVLARFGAYDKLLLNEDPEEAKGPLSPVEFAEKHGLIDKSRKRLKKKQAHRIFMSQVKLSQGKVNFTDYEKALICVFTLVRFCSARDRAKNLLDSLNLSCLKTESGFPDFSLTQAAWDEVSKLPELTDFLAKRTSTRAAIHALFDNDLMVAPAQFRWLKGLDRTLWMALSSVGRGKFFVEGAGVIAWSLSETYVLNNKLSKEAPYRTVRSAVIGLEKELISFDAIVQPISHLTQEAEREYTDSRILPEKETTAEEHSITDKQTTGEKSDKESRSSSTKEGLAAFFSKKSSTAEGDDPQPTAQKQTSVKPKFADDDVNNVTM